MPNLSEPQLIILDGETLVMKNSLRELLAERQSISFNFSFIVSFSFNFFIFFRNTTKSLSLRCL